MEGMEGARAAGGGRILMLDVEETLLSSRPSRSGKPAMARPHLELFLAQTRPLFSRRYLNTCLSRDRAFEALRSCIQSDALADVGYWPWQRFSGASKAAGYGSLRGIIVHVEDAHADGNGRSAPPETDDFKRFGVIYLPVAPFEPNGWSDDGPTYDDSDTELLRVLYGMKGILGYDHGGIAD